MVLYEEKTIGITVTKPPAPKFSDYVDYWSVSLDKESYHPGDTAKIKTSIAFKKACDYKVELRDTRGNVLKSSGWKSVSSAQDIDETLEYTVPGLPPGTTTYTYTYIVRVSVDEYGSQTGGGYGGGAGSQPPVNPYEVE